MSSIVKEKLYIGDLKVGMYVCELDRPWLETPYPLQGFYINSDADIQDLLGYSKYVYIDIHRGSNNELRHINDGLNPVFSEEDKQHVFQTTYNDSHSMENELPRAREQFRSMSASTETLLDDLAKGKTLDLKTFRESTRQMVESVIRNPDAILWLMRLKQSDDYMYQHSLRCSIMVIAFGRQLGLTKRQLNNLAIGAALLDIGKLKLPKTLLNRPGKLYPDEFEMISDHVRLSLEMISQSGRVSKDVFEMVATHHERFNGKGYPQGLSECDIPLFGRIAAIVDCYDAISSNRSYAHALSPSEAVKRLYEWRNIDFHAPLVEVFIQALGIYPAGSLVELSTGEVGVVMSEYRSRRLRPKVMLILDENKRLYKEFVTIDLYKITKTEDGQSINIQQSLEPGSYGIDPSELLLE